MIRNPIPSTTRAKNNAGYAVDSGLDIRVPRGTPCYAAADGVLVYSERGHTPWATPPDTPNSVLLKLDKPFIYKGWTVNFAWYTHLMSLAHQVPDGSTPLRVRAGDLIGHTGTGNRNDHLHFGLLSNRAQEDGDFMPPALVAELVWDQAAAVPIPTGAASALPVTVYAHDGRHTVRITEAIPPGDYQLLEPNIGAGFLRFGLGLQKE